MLRDHGRFRSFKDLKRIERLLSIALLLLVTVVFIYSWDTSKNVFNIGREYYTTVKGVRLIRVDHQNRPWVYTSGEVKDIKYFDAGTWQSISSEYPQIPIRNFVIDQKDRLWVFSDTFSVGIYVADDKNVLHYTADNSCLPRDKISDIAFDNEGRAWLLLTDFNAVTVFDENSCQTFSAPDLPFKDLNVTRDYPYKHEDSFWIRADPLGRIWVGSGIQQVLSVYDNSAWKSYELPGSPSTLLDIAFGSDGSVWLLNSAGLFLFDGTEFSEFSNQPPTNYNYYEIEVDGNNHVWAVAIEQIFVLVKGKWENFTDSDGSNFEGYVFLVSDSAGKVWLPLDQGEGIVSIDLNTAVRPTNSEITANLFLSTGGLLFLEILLLGLFVSILGGELFPTLTASGLWIALFIGFALWLNDPRIIITNPAVFAAAGGLLALWVSFFLIYKTRGPVNLRKGLLYGTAIGLIIGLLIKFILYALASAFENIG